jgi:pyridoxamine 5'-phosphate oxidase
MNDQPSGLKISDQIPENPLFLFKDWLAAAEKSEPNDPSAMTVASVDGDGLPNARLVLMRRYDERGFCFFTNFQSQKGQELLASKKAAAVFHWKTLRKQVRLRGEVEEVTKEEADEYFFSRPRGSQIASTASQQSQALSSRDQLLEEVAELSGKIGTGDIARPDHWSGFRIKPLSIEFWSDGEFRMHDRIRFDRKSTDAEWETVRLYP